MPRIFRWKSTKVFITVVIIFVVIVQIHLYFMRKSKNVVSNEIRQSQADRATDAINTKLLPRNISSIVTQRKSVASNSLLKFDQIKVKQSDVELMSSSNREETSTQFSEERTVISDTKDDASMVNNQTFDVDGDDEEREISNAILIPIKVNDDSSTNENKTKTDSTTIGKKEIESRFDERNKRILETCKKQSYISNLGNESGKGRVYPLVMNRLSWCMVPKVGTTFILYHLKPTMRFDKKHLKYSYKDDDRKSFFVVREPYGRLVSAFFSKIVSFPKWWIALGRFIVRTFRKNATYKSLKCGHDVTFSEFVKFVIYSQKINKYKNIHFIPIHELCNPCKEKKFDFISHLDTIKDDMTYILDSLNITTESNFKFEPVQNIVGHFMEWDERQEGCGDPWCPSFQRLWWALQSNGHISSSIPMPLKGNDCDNVTSSQMIDLATKAAEQSKGTYDKAAQKRKALAELYAQVSLEDRLQLRKILLMDFELFGYESTPEFVFPSSEILPTDVGETTHV